MSATDILAVQHAEAILQWYLDNGVDEAVSVNPVDRLAPKEPHRGQPEIMPQKMVENSVQKPLNPIGLTMAGSAELKSEAIKIAKAATTVDELKMAIALFDGMSLKKTAMNLVFASGNPAAHIMVIGDAPEAEDDRTGIPFSGEVGVLTDKMFAAIGLSRQEADPAKSIYLTNVLNWRPPGNRSPSTAELELSIPFIRRHIELINPQMIYLMGGVASKSVLGSDLAISKLRGKAHVAKWDEFECPVMVSYHPTFLLRSPLKKKDAWEDLLLLKQHVLQS